MKINKKNNNNVCFCKLLNIFIVNLMEIISKLKTKQKKKKLRINLMLFFFLYQNF